MAPKRIPEIPGLETDPDGSEVKPDGCRERERERERERGHLCWT